jgi:RimJ/RimL family protein N-acetyltransferase
MESNKRAFALYQKMGFLKEGLMHNLSLIDGKYENHIIMAILFD